MSTAWAGADQTEAPDRAWNSPARVETQECIMPVTAKITPCLWFDTEAEAAANHYASIFKNSKVGKISRYGKEGKEIHGKDAGSVMTVDFELDGQKFLALNGGPHFKFNEAVSFQIHCETQTEIDHFWSRLAEGGQEGPCGWLKDKFGLSWQVVPTVLPELLQDKNAERAGRAMRAMLQMKKLDIAALKQAAA
jgi:predicted 3-demethylubiquinone-9 3-methyltransferase (glyoxalase superfamily)